MSDTPADDVVRLVDVTERMGANENGCSTAVEYIVEGEPGTEMMWLDEFLVEHCDCVRKA